MARKGVEESAVLGQSEGEGAGENGASQAGSVLPLPLKYRPQVLDEVWGQDVLLQDLARLVGDAGRPHVYLFVGPAGCGKTTLGRILAKELQCSERDFRELNTANTRGIDTIREISNEVLFAPWEGPVRVYLFDEAHKLTNEAQNALLKLLEEPPEHVYFILTTTDPDKLLVTVRQRCQSFRVVPLPRTMLAEFISGIAAAEGYSFADQNLDADVVAEIAKRANGSPRMALVFLQRILGKNKEDAFKGLADLGLNETTAMDLLHCLLDKKNSNWLTVAKVMRGLNEEVESVRMALLTSLANRLLDTGNARFARLMVPFTESTYYSGKAGLTYQVFMAWCLE